LGNWYTSSLAYGKYFLNLTVYYTDGHKSEDIIIVRVDNDLHEGWPISTGEIGERFTPTIADLDGDGDLEILVKGSQSVFVYHHNGVPVSGWPQRMVGSITWGGQFPGVSVGDIDKDGKPEVLTGWNIANRSDPNSACVYAWEANGNNVSGWPIGCNTYNDYGTSLSSAVLEDLDKNGNLEIIVAGSMLNNQVYVWKYDGSNYNGWPKTIGTPGNINMRGSPAVGDIDKDGDIEIVVHYRNTTDGNGYLSIWNSVGVRENEINLGQEYLGSSPVLVDLDGDGYLEIGVGYQYGSGGSLYGGTKFFNHDGSQLWKNELLGRQMDYSSMAVGDVDSDKKFEVVFGDHDGSYGESYIHVLNETGGEQLGWPQPVEGQVYVQPVIGDINGDGKADIITTSYNKMVYAWNGSGILLSPFPKYLSAESQSGVAVGDVDKDGKVEVVAAAADGKIFLWDIEKKYNSSTMEWPMFRNNETHKGLYVVPPSTTSTTTTTISHGGGGGGRRALLMNINDLTVIAVVVAVVILIAEIGRAHV
jgi:hypothetical protein